MSRLFILCYMIAIYEYDVNAFLQTATLKQSNGGAYGDWGVAKYCDSGHFARGFRIKVEGDQNGGDDTSGNAIRLLCGEESDSTSYTEIKGNNEGEYGGWSSNTVCPSGTFIIGFDQKVEGAQGGGSNGDDTSLNSIKAKCSDGSYIESNNPGIYGSFTNTFKECPTNSYVCGFNQKVEVSQGGGDDTSLNAVRLFCCSYNLFIIESGVSGSNDYSQTAVLEQPNDGQYGSWSGIKYCNSGEFARGFKMKVEGNQNGGDDTATNAIRLLCASSSSSTSYNEISASTEGNYGSWSSNTVCPSGSYMVGFDQKVEGTQGGGDDTSLNSVRAKCSNGNVIEPSNYGAWGNWNNNYQQCPSGSYICGFNQKIEGAQGGSDDTSMNAVKMYCCKQSTQTISKKSWSDANNYCENEYGTVLATMNSDTKARELLRLRDLNSDTKTKELWIGLNDIDTENYWQWADGTDCDGSSCDASKVSYWNNGEPNDSGTGQDCGQIRSSVSNLDNLLDDNYCSGQKAFACNAPKYLFVSDSKNWWESNEYCSTEYGTQLATITNDADIDEILRLRDLNSKTSSSLWIGLNDQRVEGYWEWIDGTQCAGSCDASELTYWNSGEPNNSGGEDCAEIKGSTTSKSNLLNDNKCDGDRPFVCNAPSGGIVGDYDASLWGCFDSNHRNDNVEGGQIDGHKYCGCSDGYGVTGIYRNNCNSLYCIEEMKCGRPIGGSSTCYNENVASSFDSAGTVSCNTDYVLTGFLLNSNENCMNLYCIEKLRCCKFNGYEWNVEYDNEWGSSFHSKGWHTVAGNQYISGIERSGTNNLDGIEAVISHSLQTQDEIRAYEQALALKFAPILKFDRGAGDYPCSAEQTKGFYDENVVPQTDVTDAMANRYENTDITKSETFYKMESCDDGIKIQYRWFYARQHECDDFGNGDHYADWEWIIVHIGYGEYIEKISYFQHGSYYTVDDGTFYSEGQHPIVYVGKKSHGSYYDHNDVYGGCGYFYDFRNPNGEQDFYRTYNHPIHRLLDLSWSTYNGCWNYDDPNDCGISTDFQMDLCPYTTCNDLGCNWEGCDDDAELILNPAYCVQQLAKSDINIVDSNGYRGNHSIYLNNNNNTIYYILAVLFVLVIATSILNLWMYSNRNKKKYVHINAYDTE